MIALADFSRRSFDYTNMSQTGDAAASPITSPAPPPASERREPVVVLCRGQVECDEADAVFVRQQLRRKLTLACQRRHPPESESDGPRSRASAAVFTRLAVLEPTFSSPEQRLRPLFRRITLLPSAFGDFAGARPLAGERFCPGNFALSTLAWLSILAVAMRVAAAQSALKASSRAALTVLGVVVSLLCSVYVALGLQPGVWARNVLGTFEFFFLMAQLIVTVVCEWLEADGYLGAGGNIFLHFLWVLAFVLGYSAVDAVAVGPTTKAGRYVIFAGFCIAQIVNWALVCQVRDNDVGLGVFRTSVGSLAQSSYATIAAFMLKNAVAALGGTNVAPFRPLAVGRTVGLSD